MAFRIALFALLARLAWFFVIWMWGTENAFLLPDSGNYLEAGNSLLSGKGLSLHYEGRAYPALHLLPGYPLFAAILSGGGQNLWSLILVQILLSTLTVYFAVRWMQLISVRKSLVLALGVVLILDLPSIVYSGYVLSETLFTFLLVWGGYLMYGSQGRGGRAVIAAILLGLACLVRPIGIVLILGAAVVAVIAVSRNKRWQVLGLIALTLMPPLLWTARNWNKLGHPVYSIVAAQNLYYYRAAQVEANSQGTTPTLVRKQMSDEVLGQHNWRDDYDAGKLASIYWEESMKSLIAHPLETVKVQLSGMARLFGSPARGALQQPFGKVGSLGKSTGTAIWAVMVFQWILLLFVYWRVLMQLRHLRSWPPWQWILFGAIAAYALACGGPEIQARFRIPVLFLLVVFCGLHGTDYIRDKVRQVHL